LRLRIVQLTVGQESAAGIHPTPEEHAAVVQQRGRVIRTRGGKSRGQRMEGLLRGVEALEQGARHPGASDASGDQHVPAGQQSGRVA
jgi:hypothetical protein